MDGLLMLPWERRKPWPHDLRIQPSGGSSVGVMLKDAAEGQMVGVQTRQLDAVSPTTYAYGGLNPYKEKPFVFGPVTGGLGESVQSSDSPTRYKYARRADYSIGGQGRLGPHFTAETLVAGSEVTYLTVGVHAGDEVLFAFVGKYVYRFDAASIAWVLSHTDPSGVGFRQAVQFQGSASTNKLWVTNDIGELWAYDGAAWAQAALPIGAFALFVEKVGTELAIASGAGAGLLNEVRVCTSGDPMLAASWGGVVYVGDYGKTLTWVRAIGTTVFYFKEDGIFTITNDGGTITVNDLFPDLRNVGGTYHGEHAEPWKGYLWFQFGDTFWRLSADGTLDPIGPERLLGLDARLRRPIVAFAGHSTWFGYAVTEATDLLKFGEWVNPGEGGADEFADVWNGSLADWNTKTATAVQVTTALDGYPWLVIGFNDGTIERTRLPQFSPDPADDPSCTFVTGGAGEESYAEWPAHHAMAQADPKHWRGFSATGSLLDATCYVTVQYRTDQDAAWTELGTSFTATGQRVNTTDDVTGNVLYVRESLHGTRLSTPKVEAVVLHEQVRRDVLEIEYRCTALARHHAARHDGALDRRTAQQVRAALQATAGPGPTVIWFPDGTNQTVDFVSYGEALPNPSARYGIEWEIPVTFVQWKTITTYGTWDRAAEMNWDEASSYSWDQAPRW